MPNEQQPRARAISSGPGEIGSYPDSLRTTRFHYVQFAETDSFNVKLHARRSESAVILGASGIGKQMIFSEIIRHVETDGKLHVRLTCDEYAQSSESDFQAYMVKQLMNCFPDIASDECSWLEFVRHKLETRNIQIVFLVSNVDALPSFTARRLLQSFRVLTQLGQSAGKCCVFLSGAFDLAPLVHGPNSEFLIPDQYVIQGFDRVKFQSFCRGYTETANLQIDDSSIDYLHKQTGGNLLILRMILEALVDNRRAKSRRQESLELDELTNTIDQITKRITAFSDVVLRPFSRIEVSVSSLCMIKELLKSNYYTLPTGHQSKQSLPSLHSPTELELCGVAIRRGDRLVWASPIMEALTKLHFTHWTLGDCYACANRWKLATRHYWLAIKSNLPMGLSTKHRPKFQAALRAFETGLFRAAGDENVSFDDLQKLFAAGAKCLLGFREVTFWSFDDESAEWRFVDCNEPKNPKGINAYVRNTPDLTIRNRIQELLLGAEQASTGVLRLHGKEAAFCRVARLEETGNFPIESVVLSNFTSETPLMLESQQSAEAVLQAYIGAHKQARSNQRRYARAKLHHELLAGVTPKILQALGGEPVRTLQALRAAGDELRTGRYERVMFALVDHQCNEIRGVVDCREPSQKDIAGMTNFSLVIPCDRNNGPMYKDIQQQCVIEKLPILVDDASDRQLPNPFEREALELFAQQLAQVISATNGMDALEEATHQQADALFVIDHRSTVRFANRAASKQFGLQLGWQEKPVDFGTLLRGKKNGGDEAIKALSNAMKLKTQYTVTVKSEHSEAALHVVEAAPIKDWSEATNSFLVQIHDLSNMARLLNAIQSFARCSTEKMLADAVLDEISKLHHEWGRFYLVDRFSENQLVGIAQFGAPEDSECAAHFRNGDTYLMRTKNGTSWKAIDEGHSMVFSISPHHSFNESYKTAQGLTVFNTKDSSCPAYIEKSLEDRWIDLPLLSDDVEASRSNSAKRKALGKISVSCPPDFRPQQLKYLQILVEAASASLAAIESSKLNVELDRTRLRREQLRAIGETSHQLKSRLASVTTLAERFRLPDENVEELSHMLATRLSDIGRILEVVANRLRPMRLNLTQVAIDTYLDDILQQHFPSRGYVLRGQTGLIIELDVTLIREALDELILNARKAMGNSPSLRMSVSFFTVIRSWQPWLCIDVRDNGPGIPTERLEWIFGEFNTLWAKTGTSGDGVGLSRVSSIIAEHGGSINAVESHPGACFRIELPRFAKSSGQ